MLSDKLIKDHISFNSNCDIYNICEQFFRKKSIKVNHCNIIQKNNDKTVQYLCSNKDWLIHYFNKSYPNIGAFEHDSLLAKSKYVIWDSLDQSDPILQDSREMISVDHGITIIENFEHGIRFYNLGNNNNSSTINDYITNLADLNEFVSYLKDKLKNIIQLSYDNRFILPTKKEETIRLMPNEQNFITLESKRIYLDKNIYLSPREVECIEWYAKGKTSAEIAEILNISKRTVEAHIEHAKLKTGCVNLFQLGYMFAKLKHTSLGYIPIPYQYGNHII